MSQGTYQTNMTRRRSTMTSRWDEPEPFPDGCVVRHIPSINPNCIEHAPAEPETPEPVEEVAPTTPVVTFVPPVEEVPVAPTTLGAPHRVIVTEVPGAIDRLIASARRRPVPSAQVPKPGRRIGKDFAAVGTVLTVDELYELAASLKEVDFQRDAKVRAWVDENGFVTRVLAVESD
jgi:hypothetical protein